MRHRHVDVVAIALPFALLILEPGDPGVEVGGIAMDGDVEDIATAVEDVLYALAVVHIRVQDGDAREPR